jgi:hypothetical protein
MGSIRSKRFFIRIKNIYKRLFKIFGERDYVMTEEDKVIVKLVHSMLAKDDIKIFYAPLSHSIYMQTDDHEYTVIYNDNEIKVCNHKVFLSTKVNFKVGGNLMKTGKRKIEKLIQEMESETRKNEIEFIKGIAEILSHEKDH